MDHSMGPAFSKQIVVEEFQKLSEQEKNKIYSNYPFITLNSRQLCDYELIHNQGFKPLVGFMGRKDYEGCVNDMRLSTGQLWPIPITLHVSEGWIKSNLLSIDEESKDKSLDQILGDKSCYIVRSNYVVLKHETGLPLSLMKFSDNFLDSIYRPDILNEADRVFRATYLDADGKKQIDTNHPYVKILDEYQSQGLTHCIGGTFIHSENVPNYDFMEFRQTPQEIKRLVAGNGMNVLGFQTRNPMHRSHYELTRYALDESTKGNGKQTMLLLNPVVGITQECDVDYHTRVKCYKKMMEMYAETGIKATLCLLPLSMRMGGPREAVWHAIIRKNYGCTHFVVGRDHAGPSYQRANGGSFYGPYDAQDLINQHKQEIGIEVVTSKFIVFSYKKEKILKLYYNYLIDKGLVDDLAIQKVTDSDYLEDFDFMCCLDETQGEFKPINQIPDDYAKFNISGTKQRYLLKNNKQIPGWFSFPKIVDILRQEFNSDKGVVFYFVGLSGAGKTTVANHFMSVLKEKSFKPITYLDGDIVRRHLSKGLGFSREDRSTNVRRIGFVASEIAKHGGVCVAANIAPYAEDREYNKRLIEGKGGRYIEIYVNTDVSECESRDCKGLYHLARIGKIKLTGINDPFEAPESPDLVINGGDRLDDIMNQIVQYIETNGIMSLD